MGASDFKVLTFFLLILRFSLTFHALCVLRGSFPIVVVKSSNLSYFLINKEFPSSSPDILFVCFIFTPFCVFLHEKASGSPILMYCSTVFI